MSELLSNILEKYKRAGILDIDRSGADGKESDFIGKHTDNVNVFDGPGVAEIDKAVAAINHIKRGPERHGHEIDTDADVYESADMSYADEIEELSGMDYNDEDLVIEEDILQEDAAFFLKLIDEAVAEFYEEEADDEEREMLDEMLASDEGYQEFIDLIFEAKECDDEDDDDDDEVIEKNPKLKGKKASGDESKKEDQMVKEDITRHADVKMIKTKTPEGKVVWRKQKAEAEVSKQTD